jgi:hypothetical protein
LELCRAAHFTSMPHLSRAVAALPLEGLAASRAAPVRPARAPATTAGPCSSGPGPGSIRGAASCGAFRLGASGRLGR